MPEPPQPASWFSLREKEMAHGKPKAAFSQVVFFPCRALLSWPSIARPFKVCGLVVF
jgi:hypothetical protein